LLHISAINHLKTVTKAERNQFLKTCLSWFS
jgi:hypothetical protein